MATKIEAIGEFLRAEGLEFTPLQDKPLLHTGFRMDTYVNPAGNPILLIVISLEEDGEYLRLLAPVCYVCKNAEHFPAVLRACNHAMDIFKMIRLVLDTGDGMVAAEVHLPLENADLTHRQLVRALMVLPQVIERVDLMFREAIETGEFVPPEDPENVRRAFQEFMRQRRRAPMSAGLAE